MNRYSKATAIHYMNQLGSAGRAFMFVIDFEMDKIIIVPADEHTEQLQYQFPNHTYEFPYISAQNPPQWTKHPMAYADYQKAYDQVLSEINLGNSFLLNLAFPTELTYGGGLIDIYRGATAKYKLYLEDECVVYSPETFVKIVDGYIYSYPMKGTIDAALPGALETILADEKEQAEHYTIVDLIRNDLSMVAKEVTVTRFRYPDRISTSDKDLIQISSEIRGRLPDGYHRAIGDLLFTMLPAGSISGAPKKRTVEIIRSAEGIDRGYYTGICGYFDGRELDSGVMIRYVERTANGFRYRSGCGITSQSMPLQEYHEMIDKVYIPHIATAPVQSLII